MLLAIDALLFHCCLDPVSAAIESDLWKSGRPFIPYVDNTFLIDLLTGEFRH